jgi:hypothetical protein
VGNGWPAVGWAAVNRLTVALGFDAMPPEFYTRLQTYVVNAGIDRSVLQIRTKGSKSKGSLDTVQQFLYAADLSTFSDPNTFPQILDDTTMALKHVVDRALPSNDNLPWGFARKCLNIFLRNSTYSHYLRARYSLGGVESILEIPLDSNVAKGLKRDAAKYGLCPPRWNSISQLTPTTNADWQAIALAVAQNQNTCRVHLDVSYWRAR